MRKSEREKIKDDFQAATTKVWELVYSQQEVIFELKLEIERLRRQLDERTLDLTGCEAIDDQVFE